MLIINTEDFRAVFRCPNNTDVLLLLTKHQFLHFTFPGVDMEVFKIQPKKTFVKKAKPNNKKTHPDMLDEDFMKNNFSPRGPAGVYSHCTSEDDGRKPAGRGTRCTQRNEEASALQQLLGSSSDLLLFQIYPFHCTKCAEFTDIYIGPAYSP